jgi:23S rRNA pseudouridine1911/1915/1917 synthase
MKTPNFTVKRGEAAVRLVDFLARELATSKKKSKALLDGRHVFVNGRRVWMARHMLKAGDRIEVAGAPPGERRNGPDKLRVLHEDEDFLVINKPPGLLSNGNGSVEALLREQRGCPALRAAHRLDRDTSGCLLIARSNTAFDLAVSLFRERRVHKTYHAIATGQVERSEREVRKALEGQRALTRYRVLDATEEASHLLVSIGTGRTHQIRQHLHQEGHPVLGDRRYGTGGKLPQKARQVRRQMLHASSLAFTDRVRGTSLRTTSPLPPDFRKTLRSFGLK